MSSLSERMYKTRLSTFPVEGLNLVLLRPNYGDFSKLQADGFPLDSMDNRAFHEVARRFVVGWKDVKECDIIKGGSTDTIPFDRDAWHELLADHIDWWIVIGSKVMEIYSEHQKRMEGAAKN